MGRKRKTTKLHSGYIVLNNIIRNDKYVKQRLYRQIINMTRKDIGDEDFARLVNYALDKVGRYYEKEKTECQ